MKISTVAGKVTGKRDAIVAFLFDDEVKSPKLPSLDRKTATALLQLITASKFSGGHTETVSHFSDSASAPLIILQGLGKRSDFTWRRLRLSAGAASRAARNHNAKSVAFTSEEKHFDDLSIEQVTRALVDGIILGLWRFDHYRPKKKETKELNDVAIYFATSARKKSADKILGHAIQLAECHCMARDYGTHPANVITTDYLVSEAKKLSKRGIKVTILERAQLKKLGMNLILAVGQASVMPPRIIIMDWNPRGAKKTFAFVGKGVVFDSGGLNIKVSMMEEMKSDMCGAAAVLSAMRGIVELKPKHRVIGVVGAVENAISSNAYRPSDIYTAYNGKTVEIGNTDAEGRLVLGDCLSYTIDKYKPDAIVDLATLTGAAVVALGHHIDAIFTNNERWQKQLLEAAERSGERFWPMPILEEHVEEIKGDVAQIRNSVGHRWGGACTAAAFLKEFVGDTPWVHLDIAPTTFPATPSSIQPKMTASGVGAKTLLELVTQ